MVFSGPCEDPTIPRRRRTRGYRRDRILRGVLCGRKEGTMNVSAYPDHGPSRAYDSLELSADQMRIAYAALHAHRLMANVLENYLGLELTQWSTEDICGAPTSD